MHTHVHVHVPVQVVSGVVLHVEVFVLSLLLQLSIEKKSAGVQRSVVSQWTESVYVPVVRCEEPALERVFHSPNYFEHFPNPSSLVFHYQAPLGNLLAV